MIKLHIDIDSDRLPGFCLVLQGGFTVYARVGSSIRDFLCDQIGIDPDYVTGSIQTIFLDGKPVDDIGCAMIRDGSSLTLSSAMPGLVGATLRCGSPLASFRSTITYSGEGAEGKGGGQGAVHVKLFNLMIAGLGPVFLARGIMMKSGNLEAFLRSRHPDVLSGCRRMLLNGQEVGPDDLMDRPEMQDEMVYLTVAVSDEEQRE